MALDSESIWELIRSHMEEQPYRITCTECGANLESSTVVDSDLDVEITVAPCSCTLPKEER